MIFKDITYIKNKRFIVLLILLFLLLGAASNAGNIVFITFSSLLALHLSLSSKSRIINDSFFLLLLMFSFSYIFIYLSIGYFQSYVDVLSAFILPCGYVIGITTAKKRFSQIVSIYLIIFLSLFLALPHFYITIRDILSVGIINPLRDLQILSDEQMPVTLRMVYVSPILIWGPCLLFKCVNSSENTAKLICIILFFMSFLCVVHFLSRTGLTVFFMSFLFSPFLLKLNKRTILLFLLLMVISYFFYNLYASSELFVLFSEREIEGSSISDAGGRFDKWIFALTNIGEHPFGGVGNVFFTFAHNYWLDVAIQVGIIPFVILVVLSIKMIIYTLKCFFRDKPVYLFHYILLLMILLLVVPLFLEPIIQGAPYLLFYYYFLFGWLRGIH